AARHEDQLLLRSDAAVAEQRPDEPNVRWQAQDEVHHLGHVPGRADAISQCGPLPAGTVPEARATRERGPHHGSRARRTRGTGPYRRPRSAVRPTEAARAIPRPP